MYISWLCPCNAWDRLHRHNEVPAQVEVRLHKVHSEKFHFTHFIFTYFILYYQAIILCFFFDSVKNKILNFAHFLHATKNSQIPKWWGMKLCLTF